MSVKIEIDTSKFNRAIRELTANVEKDRNEVLREEMGLLVQRMVELTAPPHGRGSGQAGKKMGENAVSRDIQRVFTGAEPEYIQEYGKKFPYFRTSGGGAYLFQETVDPQFHQTFRDSRGRVRRKGSRLIRIGSLEFSDKVHVVKAQLQRYIRSIQAKVGQAKAGWMAAAIKFKARGIPGWVRRHGTKHGSASQSFTRKSAFVEAVNRNKAIASLDSNSRIVATAIRSRTRDIQNKLQRIMDRNARKFSRR